jgi:integrase
VSRPPLVIGTWGRINRVRRGAVWVAYARYRDHDGATRQIERSGASAQKAEDALKLAMTKRLALENEDLTAESTLSSAGEVWFTDLIEGRKALNTERAYRDVLDGIIAPGLGSVRLRELSVSRLDRFLKLTTKNRGPAAARRTRSVLSGVVGLAARRGAITSNPLRDVDFIEKPAKEVLALSLEQLWDLRAKMYANQLAVDRDLPEPIDFMLGTGARIGEMLAMRWKHLDLDAARPTALIRATAVWVNGRGMIIQEHPKTASSWREVVLPAFLREQLEQRRRTQKPNTADLVFPSERGTVRDGANVRRQWRQLRQEIGYEWVIPHTFRKTVATLTGDPELASQQLGHSGTAVTKKNYIPKTHVAPDLREMLDRIDEPAFTQRKHRLERAATDLGRSQTTA